MLDGWKWSPAEKTAARRAFNLALDKELDAVMCETKSRAAKMTKPSELWELERWLGKRGREIDELFDYRYSVLPIVFAALLRDGRITEDDLHGLSPEKIASIKSIADFYR